MPVPAIFEFHHDACLGRSPFLDSKAGKKIEKAQVEQNYLRWIGREDGRLLVEKVILLTKAKKELYSILLAGVIKNYRPDKTKDY